MEEHDCIALIQKHEKLERLFTQKDIGTLTDFKEQEFQNEDFKKYIAKDYLESVLTIVSTNMYTKKEGKVIAILRSLQYLATDEVKEKVAIAMEPYTQEGIASLNAIHQLTLGKMDEVTVIENQVLFGKSMNNALMSIFNFVDYSPAIKGRKKEFLDVAMAILRHVADLNPKRETGKYMVYNALMNNLEKIKRMDEHTSEFRHFEVKIEKKRKNLDVRYVIGIVIFVIVLLLKLARGFA